MRTGAAALATIDPSTGAIYVYLPGHPRSPGCVARTVEDEPGLVMIDFDARGTLIGVEILHRALTPAQRHARSLADQDGRAHVTMIDGRVAIILPDSGTDDAGCDASAAYLAAVCAALDKAGLA